MKIYTRKGDSGDTSLFGGKRVPKDHVRVEAYGSVDELNSALGLALTTLPEELADQRARLNQIQSDCFTVGAILATPKTGEAKPGHIPELSEARVTELEAWIDDLEAELAPLDTFVLPGGAESAAAFHLARSICRRAERRLVSLAQSEEVEPVVTKYLNRLSDFLFSVARTANSRLGLDDVPWHRPDDS